MLKTLGLNKIKKAPNNRTINALSTYDLDFVNDTYKGGAVTFTSSGNNTDLLKYVAYRYTDSWVENPDGTVSQRTANRHRRNGYGLWVEQDRTNDVLWSCDLSNAVWTKTNITATKNQTGVDGVANSASSITATANNGTVTQAITAASNGRMQSFFVKRLTGSGTLETTMDGGTTWIPITVTSSWARQSIPQQTLTNPTVGFRIGASGDSFAIDFVQNEVGNTISGPLRSTTTAYRSWGDRSSMQNISPIISPIQTGILSGAFGFYMELCVARIEQCGPFVSDGTNGVQVRIETNGSVSYGTAVTGTGQFTRGRFTTNKIAGYITAGGTVAICCNGNAVVTSTRSLPTGQTHTDLATNGSLGMSIHGVVKRVAFFNGGVLTNNDLINFTKS